MREGLARACLWSLARWVHRWDYAAILPALARMPLWLGWHLASLRGGLNAQLQRDWRSMALGTRHVARLSQAAAEELNALRAAGRQTVTDDVRAWAADGGVSDVSGGTPTNWVSQRFAAEARDEFEACLMHARRWPELHCRFEPPDAPQRLIEAAQSRGLVLLTPHFDSFYLGIAFLAQASGATVNAMSSAVPADPRVDAAVTNHFMRKYRGLEQALNGGQVVDMEDGLRPFFRMLQRNETLVVLADAPVLPGGARLEVPFLGGKRALAGGAQRLAQHAQAPMAAFVCRYEGWREGHPRYVLNWCEAGPAQDPATLPRLYAFMGDAILRQPGRWWAMDMLPNLSRTKGDSE